MAAPGKSGSKIKNTEQSIFNDSRDDKYGVVATELVAENAAENALLRLKADDSGNLKVNIQAGAGSGGTASTDDAAFTAGAGSGTPMMGFATSDSVDAGDVGVLAMDTSRNLKVSIEADNAGIGGGTQYTDADANAAPTGTVAMGTDGANVYALATDASGNLQVDILNSSIPVTDNGGSLTVDGTVTANLSATDNAVLDTIETNTDFGTVVGGGVEATALRVTLANDSTGVLSVDDNGGSLTVDGTVAATQSGTWNVTNISGTVSLPTGASTAANQSTIIGHVDGIETLLGTIDADTSTLAATDFMLGTDFTAVFGTTSLVTTANLADNLSNGQDVLNVRSLGYVFDGTTWDRARGDSTDGMLVNLGSNNDVTVSGTVAATQSGTWNITDISGTVSLPTGASTAANQSTIIGHVDGIETLLGTIDADTSTLAGAVSGSEMQVDIVSGTVTANLSATDNAVLDQLVIEMKINNGAYAQQTDVSGTTTYRGWAVPGTATSAASWRITRIVETSGDYSIDFADGNDNFDNIWDNRASLSYS